MDYRKRLRQRGDQEKDKSQLFTSDDDETSPGHRKQKKRNLVVPVPRWSFRTRRRSIKYCSSSSDSSPMVAYEKYDRTGRNLISDSDQENDPKITGFVRSSLSLKKKMGYKKRLRSRGDQTKDQKQILSDDETTTTTPGHQEEPKRRRNPVENNVDPLPRWSFRTRRRSIKYCSSSSDSSPMVVYEKYDRTGRNPSPVMIQEESLNLDESVNSNNNVSDSRDSSDSTGQNLNLDISEDLENREQENCTKITKVKSTTSPPDRVKEKKKGRGRPRKYPLLTPSDNNTVTTSLANLDVNNVTHVHVNVPEIFSLHNPNKDSSATHQNKNSDTNQNTAFNPTVSSTINNSICFIVPWDGNPAMILNRRPKIKNGSS